MLSKRSKKIIITLIIIQSIALIFLALNNSLYTWDEASYLINALDTTEQLEPNMQNYVAHERHPLLSWLIAGTLLLHLPSIFYQLLSLVSLALLFLLIYKMGTKFYSQEVGFLAGFILITIPTLVFLSTKILTDIPGGLLFSFCLYLYYKGLDQPKYFLWGGFVGGVSIMMRDMNILLVPILGVFGLIFWRRINKNVYFLSIPVAILALLPYLLDNYLRWGHPLFRIIKHIEMVQQGIGYQAFSLQSLPFLWLIFLPLLIGLPIFILFLQHIYRRRKELFKDKRLQFLLIWFFVPFVIFLVRQKLTPRLIPIFVIPVLLLGTRELLSKNKRNFRIWLTIILIVNLFLVGNFFIYSQVSLSASHQEAFNFIQNNIGENETLHSNGSPPSVIAWHTKRTTFFELHPDQNSTVTYYLYDGTYEKYAQRTKLDPNNYEVMFENRRYTLYKINS